MNDETLTQPSVAPAELPPAVPEGTAVPPKTIEERLQTVEDQLQSLVQGVMKTFGTFDSICNQFAMDIKELKLKGTIKQQKLLVPQRFRKPFTLVPNAEETSTTPIPASDV